MFRNLVLGIAATLVGSAAFWWILLFLSPLEGWVAWLFVTLVLGSIAVWAMVAYMKRQYENKLGTCLTILLAAGSIWALTGLLSAGNMLLYDVEKEMTEKTELAVEAKLGYYRYILTGKDGTVDLKMLEKTQKEGITFYYAKGTEPSEAIHTISDFIGKNKKQYQESIGGKTDAEVSIVLYGDSMKMPERESIKMEHSGFYKENSGTIHIPLPIEEDLLAHEYIHHLVAGIAKERGMYTSEIPVWFNEGIAAYLSEREESVSRTFIEETEYIEFQKLEKPGGWENHLNPPNNPYFQSSSFLGYLVENEGKDVFSRIFKETGISNFPDAFKKETGKTVEEYEQAFVRDFKKLPKLWDEAHMLEVKNKEYEKSLKKFLAVADIIPKFDLVNHRIANLYMELGQFDKAVAHRTKELKQALAEDRNSLDASYMYLAGSLLFTDIREAVEAAEMGMEVSTEESLSWNKGILNELISLETHIENGRPFKGYLEILNGQYTINNGSENQGQKIALIDIALTNFPKDNSSEYAQLIELRKSLETQLAAVK